MARRIRDDIVQLQACAWVYWQVVDNFGGWGMLKNPLDGRDSRYSLNKKYYAMAQFSRYVRPGFQILHAGDANSLAAYDAKNHALVIITVNDSKAPFKVTFDLDAFSAPGSEARRYRTSSSENIAAVGPAAITDNRIVSIMLPQSVTTHVVSNVVAGLKPASVNDNTLGNGLNQFEYIGNWQYYGAQSGAFQRDNHWSEKANDLYQVRFDGSRVHVYGAKDSVCGMAAMSIDGGGESLVDFYSRTRVDNALVWISPVLASGPHSLRVRVTGTKNRSSSGCAVPVDRVDVVGAPHQ